ncbi:MAG: NADH-quinone oxidoreductase subunit N [Methanobacteriota archaeon]
MRLWGLALGGLVVSSVLTLDLMGLRVLETLGISLWESPVGPSGDFASELRVRVDLFALFFHAIFLFVAFLAILASRGFLRPEEPHQGEYYALMLISVVGMMFTAAATDLFVLFLAFEISSLSTFALVAFRKKDRQATEASAKFFIIGAVSTALILFGISLVYGIAGTSFDGGGPLGPSACVGNLTGLDCLRQLSVGAYPAIEPPLTVALVLLIAGFGFKVAVVPFHMWAPDVYQGSPTAISAFLAAGSKKVGIVAMFRVFLIGLLAVQIDWLAALGILAIATQTVGNVLAIPQRSVKRMLAYSSIAQAGYILIALAVGAIALAATDPGLTAEQQALAEVVAVAGMIGGVLHVLTHAAMKAGSFLVVAGTESQGLSDDMDSYRGLGRRAPFLAFSMTIFLLSLAGIPPLGGFFSKFVLFSSAVSAFAFNPWYLALAISGVLNSALSLYYYARVIWYMYILEPSAEAPRILVPRSISAAVFVALAVVILVTFLVAFFYGYLEQAAKGFFGFA